MLGRELADSQHHTLAAKLAEARVIIGASNLFEPIEELQLQDDGELKGETQDAAGMLQFDAAGSIVQTKMTDADKPIGQNMREETADEFQCRESHGFFFAVVAIIEILEGDCIFSNGNNTMIGNGNAEDVATEILDQLFFVIERGLDIDFPIFGQGLLQHILNIERAVMGIEFGVCPELGDFEAETIAELIGKQFDGEEELVVSRIPSVTSGGGNERAARNNEMDMQMLLHGLTPGMHDHRKADLATEILLPEVFEQLRGNFDEQIENQFLVERHQRIEDMVNGEDHMKIMNGQ